MLVIILTLLFLLHLHRLLLRLLLIIKKCPGIAQHMSVKKGTDEDEESGASAGE